MSHPRVDTSILTQPQQNEMLAKGIPSLTPSAGNTAMDDSFPAGQQFDLNVPSTAPVHFRPNGWPRSGPPYGDRWLHNDVRVMAYLYTFRVYTKIVELGGL